jgi:hypothetical protein
VIDAAGLLTVTQKAVPLETDITRFGEARPNDVRRVSVHELRLGAASVSGTADAARTRAVTEAFAPAAFADLPDTDKLRAPAFEQRPAGVQALSGEGLTTDAVVPCTVEYDTAVFDSEAHRPETRVPEDEAPVPVPDAAIFGALVHGGAASGSSRSRDRRIASQRNSVLDIAPPRRRYAVTRIDQLVALDEDGGPVTAPGDPDLLSFTGAQDRRAALIAAGVADDLQILPEAQIAS